MEMKKFWNRNPHVPKRSKQKTFTFQKCFFSELFFPVQFCKNHPFHGHLLWTNRYFPREEFLLLHSIYISLSAFSCFENVWVQCLLEAGESFSMLCLPCWAFSFPQQLTQFSVRVVGILACLDSWLILWHSFVQLFLKDDIFLGRLC